MTSIDASSRTPPATGVETPDPDAVPDRPPGGGLAGAADPRRADRTTTGANAGRRRDPLAGPGPLDIGGDQGARLLARATELVVRHLAEVPDGPVAPPDTGTAEIRAWLAGLDLDTPRDADEVMTQALAALRRWGVHTTHPRYLGLFNPTPTWWGVAGDLLAAGVNPQLAAYSHAPAAVEIERHVLAFLAGRLGMPAGSVGSFTSGGAEANLTAVIAALTRRFPEYGASGLAAAGGAPVLYASAESHLAWLKIAHMTGLGREAVRLVGVDDRYRMDVPRLRAMIADDLAAGRLPFLVVGTVGTTGGGAVDPVPDLLAVAREHGLWLHVDAAWGGAVALSDRFGAVLAGVGAADSVTVDAHKWLSAPMAAGMFLTRHPGTVADSFRVSTSYMPADVAGTADPYTSSVQWSRRFTGLKVFLALAVAGRAGYAAQIERDVALGGALAGLLAERGWLRINDTLLPVVCVVDPDAERDGPERSAAWHTAVADAVVGAGRAWISPVRLAGRAALRACVTSYRTRIDDLHEVVAALDAARDSVGRPGAAAARDPGAPGACAPG